MEPGSLCTKRGRSPDVRGARGRRWWPAWLLHSRAVHGGREVSRDPCGAARGRLPQPQASCQRQTRRRGLVGSRMPWLPLETAPRSSTCSRWKPRSSPRRVPPQVLSCPRRGQRPWRPARVTHRSRSAAGLRGPDPARGSEATPGPLSRAPEADALTTRSGRVPCITFIRPNSVMKTT